MPKGSSATENEKRRIMNAGKPAICLACNKKINKRDDSLRKHHSKHCMRMELGRDSGNVSLAQEAFILYRFVLATYLPVLSDVHMYEFTPSSSKLSHIGSTSSYLVGFLTRALLNDATKVHDIGVRSILSMREGFIKGATERS